MAYGIPPNDNWFNFGKLLGRWHSKNYEDRGHNKALAAIDDMYGNPAPTAEETNAAQGEMRKKLMQDVLKNPGGLTAGIDFAKFGSNLNGNTSSGNNSDRFTLMVPEEYRSNLNKSVSDSKGVFGDTFRIKPPAPVEKQPEGVFGSAQYKFDPDRTTELIRATTPSESSVMELASQNARNRQNANFNATDFMAGVNRKIAGMKLSPEARQSALEYAAAKAQEGQRQLYEQKSDALVSEYNKLVAKGDHQAANALLPQLIKYSQPLTQMLLGSGVTNKELYGYAENKKIRDEEHAQKKEIMELYPKHTGGGGYGGYGGSRSASGSSNARPPSYLGVVGQQGEVIMQALESGDVEQIDKAINKMKQLVGKHAHEMTPEIREKINASINHYSKLRDMRAGNFGDSADDKTRKERAGGGLFSSFNLSDILKLGTGLSGYLANSGLFNSKDDNSISPSPQVYGPAPRYTPGSLMDELGKKSVVEIAIPGYGRNK